MHALCPERLAHMCFFGRAILLGFVRGPVGAGSPLEAGGTQSVSRGYPAQKPIGMFLTRPLCTW